MKTDYGVTPHESVAGLKKYYYGAIISLLYFKEDGYPQLDGRIQTLINQIHGSMKLFGNDPKVLAIIAWLEDARERPDQFRKDILDAANMVDQLKDGDYDV